MSHFAKPVEPQTSIQLKKTYQHRKKYLSKRSVFMSDGKIQSAQEKKCLHILRDMIKGMLDVTIVAFNHSLTFVSESFNGPFGRDEYCRKTCPNMDSIRQFALATNILRDMFLERQTTSQLMEVIQVLLTHVSLDLKLGLRANCFEHSQQQAYLSSQKQPLFLGERKQYINFTWLRHTINFFRHHFINENDGLLAQYLSELQPDELPSGWTTKIENGVQELGTYWKGTYAYIDHNEIEALRKGKPGTRYFSDGHLADDGEGKNPIQVRFHFFIC